MSQRSGSAVPAPLCPSAPAAPGAALIGIVQQDGHVANLPTALPVDRAFIDRAGLHGTLERRFRFAAPCQAGRCTHWTGAACALIGHIMDETAGHAPLATRPPPCAIRAVCRWWDQEGPAACAVCTLVATDTRAEAQHV
jgi:hypothetical protein